MEISTAVLEELEVRIKRARGLAIVASDYTYRHHDLYGRPAFHAIEALLEAMEQARALLSGLKTGEAADGRQL